jgi:molybdenum cofactor cytidylyltransferase
MWLLDAQIRSLAPHCEFVIVVGGANAESLLPTVYARAAFLVANPEPARGQFSSLQTGLQEVLNRGRDKALITHVDRIPAAGATIEQLKVQFARAERGEKWLVVPEYNGQHGHPVVAGREMIEVWLKSPLDATARDIEHAYQARIDYLPVDDANVLANVNTPEEYGKLNSQ